MLAIFKLQLHCNMFEKYALVSKRNNNNNNKEINGIGIGMEWNVM